SLAPESFSEMECGPRADGDSCSPIMDDYDIRSAASILASVKEQEARFERLTRALEEERRNVSLQLERANQPSDRVSISWRTWARGCFYSPVLLCAPSSNMGWRA
uniref:Uncharacterized protein n=1 Tax=Varanus komodoensis TaxID=61221 RepID=A0A8D2LTP1_VARKO